jgi:hypothetical protein
MAAEFIVAEIAKTWAQGQQGGQIISKQFEQIIATNLERGYVLYSFAHSQVLGVREQQETIVAVFRKTQGKAKRSTSKRCLRCDAGPEWIE